MQTKTERVLPSALIIADAYHCGRITPTEFDGQLESLLTADVVDEVMNALPHEIQEVICSNISRWRDIEPGQKYAFEPLIQPEVILRLRELTKQFREKHPQSDER